METLVNNNPTAARVKGAFWALATLGTPQGVGPLETLKG